ncbi:MAG: glycosyltransferase family 4 protein [Deltaproteobacteria bacterium]|nr:glycosyltransferase family 4 protein [Deltaproteobacteria bacterium]
MKIPNLAYVLLWFPKPSETFIFREVMNLWALGLPIKVFTLYGELKNGLSPEMIDVSPRMERLGRPYLKSALKEIGFWKKRDPQLMNELLRTIYLRRPKGLEKTGENWWSALCAFRLARRFLEEGIEHIHAPWANGPATAAWTAAKLTGLPFSFTARAWDIYPPDNLLLEKIRDAAFVRSETRHNIDYLLNLTGQPEDKFHLTYNGVPLIAKDQALVKMKPPYRFLALGRFVGKKGFAYLLKAARILKDRQIDFHLTLAGDGPLKKSLEQLTRDLGLTSQVTFPGFVTHDRVSDLFQETDIFLMPSVVDSSGDRDGIPLVLMEALLHRVPVVATNVSGIPELVRNEETGLLIAPNDPEALADSVVRLIDDRQSALNMAERGRVLIREQFEPQRNYQKVFDLYLKLWAGPSKGTRP